MLNCWTNEIKRNSLENYKKNINQTLVKKTNCLSKQLLEPVFLSQGKQVKYIPTHIKTEQNKKCESKTTIICLMYKKRNQLKTHKRETNTIFLYFRNFQYFIQILHSVENVQLFDVLNKNFKNLVIEIEIAWKMVYSFLVALDLKDDFIQHYVK